MIFQLAIPQMSSKSPKPTFGGGHNLRGSSVRPVFFLLILLFTVPPASGWSGVEAVERAFELLPISDIMGSVKEASMEHLGDAHVKRPYHNRGILDTPPSIIFLGLAVALYSQGKTVDEEGGTTDKAGEGLFHDHGQNDTSRDGDW